MAVRAAAGTPDLLTSGARKPPTTTYSELQGVLFSSLLAFAYLLSSLAFLVLIADLRSFSGKVLAGLWFLIPYYSGNLHGMMLAPDYLNWLLPVGLVMVKVFSRWDVIADVAWSRRDLIFLAAFAALASAVKPTMAIYAFSVAVALLISRPRIWTSLVFCMLAAISAIAGYLLILSFFYHGNPSHLKMFFELEQVFLSTAAQSSPAYFSWVKANITSSWMVGGAIVLPFVSVLAMCVTRRRKAVGPVVGIGVGALVYQVVLYSRFVPSTQFEAGIFVQCALASLLLACFPKSRRGVIMHAGALVIILACAIQIGRGARTLRDEFPNLAQNSRGSREMDAMLAASARDTVFLIPDNNYRPITVDMAIFKGSTDIRWQPCHTDIMAAMLRSRYYLTGSEASYRSQPPDLSQFGQIVITHAKDADREQQKRNMEKYFHVSLVPYDLYREFDLGGQCLDVYRHASTPASAHIKTGSQK